jgi:putative ABC transport system ATP-binding protein
MAARACEANAWASFSNPSSCCPRSPRSRTRCCRSSSRADATPLRARDVLQRVGLGERLGHYPRQLSGGEQQRVAVARAFVTEPRLLFADEPTGNLDSETGEHVIDLLFEMNRERGTTLVLVTHDPDLAKRCDRRIHIGAGEIVAED